MERFNQTLRFSVGHVLALLSLVAIAYVCFMGLTYAYSGDYSVAGILATGVLLLLGWMIYQVQLLKATERRFARRIWWERGAVLLFIILSAIVFWIPYSHFWVVLAREKRIRQHFAEAVGAGKRMFQAYEQYANERETAYESALREWIRRPKSAEYKQCQFMQGLQQEQIENALSALRLKLLGDRYKNLQDQVNAWSQSIILEPSIRDIFLLGNVREIQQALNAWHRALIDWSDGSLSGEKQVARFDPDGAFIAELSGHFTTIQAALSAGGAPTSFAWLTGPLLFALLSLPYLLQSRHTKAQGFYFLLRAPRAKAAGGFADDRESVDSDAEPPAESDADSSQDPYRPFTL